MFSSRGQLFRSRWFKSRFFRTVSSKCANDLLSKISRRILDRSRRTRCKYGWNILRLRITRCFFYGIRRFSRTYYHRHDNQIYMICAGQHTSGTAGGIFLFDDALSTTNSISGGSIGLTVSSLSSYRYSCICRDVSIAWLGRSWYLTYRFICFWRRTCDLG